MRLIEINWASFREAITCFMDEYSWWRLFPVEVHLRGREAVIGLLEQ